MELKIQATNVLERMLEAEKQGFKIIEHEGGSRSSKTWSIFQFFILKALAGERITVTVLRDKLTWIRTTLIKDLEDIVSEYSLPITPDINTNRGEQVYRLNGSEIAFFGADYPEKLHGRKQDWFWINEAMEVGEKHFDQLEMRTSVGGVIDYNPAGDSHWVYDIQRRSDVKLIHSTMLDNPFLPDQIINKIRSYEPTPYNIEQGTADSYMWEVYGLGNRARLRGLVFDNWEIVDEIPPDANSLGFGLDFGYTNDPTAFVEGYLYNNDLYLNEILYETGLTNNDIVDRLDSMEVSRDSEIWADSAEPKSIEEIRRSGFRGIKPVVKGSDSINFGIDIIKGYKVYITKRSVNLEKELRNYKWAEDKEGKTLNKPVDEFNHLIDATRYLAMSKLATKPKPRVYTHKARIFS